MSNDVNQVATSALAYLGDCVIELKVRNYLVSEKGLSSSASLNREALNFVRASAQSEAMNYIEPLLDEDEMTAYRRGRNIGHTNIPKSATALQYRRATGMEALFGYLHLNGKNDRIDELFSIAYADTIALYRKA